MTLRQLGTAALTLALVATSAACGPKREVQVGLNDYSTDIVFGAKRRPAPPPLTPAADPTPAFPGFIQPPPRVPVPDAPGAPPPTTTVRAAACPEADVFQIPPPAPVDVIALPPAGTYPFRVSGTAKVGAVTIPVAGEQRRTVSHVTAAEPTWKVATAAAGGVVTTTYVVRRPAGNPSLAGIYVTQVVMERPGAAPEEFAPVQPGLRLFALPAALGTAWTSVATDPVHATSMRLSATITQKRRINACGTVAEGWEVDVNAEILGIGPGDKEVTVAAKYLVSTGLGGLIIADNVRLQGRDRGVAVSQHVDAIVNRVAPLR